MVGSLLIALLVVLASVYATASLPSVSYNNGIINKQVGRLIDLQQQWAEEVVSVSVTATKDSNYYLLSYAAGSRVSFVEAFLTTSANTNTNNGNDGQRLPVDEVIVSDAPESSIGAKFYRVSVAITSGRDITLQIHAAYSRVLVAYPATIKQGDTQRVHYSGSSLFYSPYRTTKQQTTFKLPSPKIEDYTREGAHVKGNEIVYGPYNDVIAYADGEANIHFENNAPFATAVKLIRELEVSHYGNLAIEEHYEIVHTGAKLATGFSRHDYQRQQQQGGAPSSWRHITAILPTTATDIYYRDQIGNISTSHVREQASENDEAALIFDVEPRFPMFGGWSTDFYIGYNLPLSDYLLEDDQTGYYVLNVSFGSPFPQLTIDEIEVRIILPEGADDLSWYTPFEIDSESRDTRLTYLDTTGRTVLILKKSNVLRHHNQAFLVAYSFSSLAMWQEPLLLVAGFALFFVASMAYMRLELSISSSSSSRSSLRSRRSGPIGDAINALLTIQPRLIDAFDRKLTQEADSLLVEVQRLLAPLLKVSGDRSVESIAIRLDTSIRELKAIGKKYGRDTATSDDRDRYAAAVASLDQVLDDARRI